MIDRLTNTAETKVTDRTVAGPQPDPSPPSGTTAGAIPVGGIILYSGAFAAIPANWHLCDGADGTPDLTDRFVLGTNTEAEVGNSGGSAQHVHAVGTLANDSATAGTPAGSLDAVSAGTPAGTVSVNNTTATDTATTGAGTRVTNSTASFAGSALGNHTHTFTGAALAGHTHTITGKTANAEDGAGSTDPLDVRPPWFKLAFIQRMS